MGERSERAVAELEAERGQTLRTLLGIDEAACRTPMEWYGRRQSVGHMLRQFTSHSLDHFQHLHRLLQARGRTITEAQLLLMKAEAAQAEFTALVRSLSDTEFAAGGPNDGDWSAEQIVGRELDVGCSDVLAQPRQEDVPAGSER